MTLVADVTGKLRGKFTIPAGVRAGAKGVEILGAGGSNGSATFVGQGTLVSEVLQSVTRVRKVFYDPLAQTFSMAEENQIGGVELYVTAKGTTPIIVQIRETQTGLPTQNILAEGRLTPAQITSGTWNRWEFDQPVRLLANVEYAIVVLCNDAVGEIAIAELGKFDTAGGRWVTQQPYQVGTLLSSSNASTWTPHQDRDMAFRLLARRYTQTSREVNLGNVAVTGITDLVILPMTDNPATGADSDLQLTMPDGAVISASDGQSVSFPVAVTGNIGVKARLRATTKSSAVLLPGSQIVAGTVATTADYVSRAMDADAAGCNVRVIFDALLPSGSSVAVFVSGIDGGDTWVSVPQDGTAKPLGDDVYEYQHFLENVTEAKIRMKLELTGTIAARPFVYNLRVSVT